MSIEERKKLFYYNNNDKLYQLLDSIKTANKPVQSGRTEAVDENPSIIWRIPIQFWACRPAGAYSDAIAANHVQVMVDDLNRNHIRNNTPFRFYQLCEIKTLVTNSTISENDTKSLSRNPDALNLYMVEALNIGGNIITNGGFWNQNTGGIFVCRQHSVSTPTHEVGHAFGLRHTHSGATAGGLFESCFREPVDRDKRWTLDLFMCGGVGNTMCSGTGDDLCDTPADPNLDYFGRVDSCKYADKINRDQYGDSYFYPPNGSRQPDPRNIMSYASQRSCRNFFSQGQIAVMTANLANNSVWKSPDIRFDSYEPDNTLSTARRIGLGEVQLHTFHAQQTNRVLGYCDVDNISFDITTRGSYTVRTFREIFKNDYPDTYLTLYRRMDDGSGQYVKVIGGENDNDPANAPFSLLQLDLEVGSYIAEISNKGAAALNASARGWYNVIVEPCIDSKFAVIQSTSETFCAGQEYEFWIDPLQGANNYEWSFNPNFRFMFVGVQNTNRIRVRLLSYASASEAIVVTVAPRGVCGIAVPVSRTILLNKPFGGVSYSEYFEKTACVRREKITVKIAKKAGYTYQISSTSTNVSITEVISSTESYWEITSNAVGVYPIVVSASNACGSSILDNFDIQFYNCANPCEGSAKVYPNPAVNYLQIDFDIALYSTNFDLRLFNSIGQEIPIKFSRTEENLKLKNVTIDTQNLPTGLYYLVVNAESLEGNFETNSAGPRNPCRMNKTILIEKDGIEK